MSIEGVTASQSCPRCGSPALDKTIDESRRPAMAAVQARTLFLSRSNGTLVIAGILFLVGFVFFPLWLIAVPLGIFGVIGLVVNNAKQVAGKPELDAEELSATRFDCRECRLAWYPAEFEMLKARHKGH